MNKKNNVVTSRNINLSIRQEIIKTYVWSAMLYSSKRWTKTEGNRLLALETCCWKAMQQINCGEHRENVEVFRKARIKWNFMINLKKKVNLIGHALTQ